MAGRRKKEEKEDIDIDLDDIDNQNDDETAKKPRRQVKKSKKLSAAIEDDTNEETDYLENVTAEVNDNRNNNNKNRREHRVIDPESQIGQLSTSEILAYLSKKGFKDENYQLISAISIAKKILRGSVQYDHILQPRRRRNFNRDQRDNHNGYQVRDERQDNRPRQYGKPRY